MVGLSMAFNITQVIWTNKNMWVGRDITKGGKDAKRSYDMSGCPRVGKVCLPNFEARFVKD